MTFSTRSAPCRPHRIVVFAAAFALSLASALPVAAQDPSASDLRALRFYIGQGDTGAAEAELRRLRVAFPDWVPPEDPEDLFSDAGPADVGRIYALIASGEFAEARALIAETDANHPEWSPPDDMLALLSLSEAQRDFDAFVSAGDAASVIRIARGIPTLLSCERVNNAWELAEAHLRRGETEEALSVYRAVLGACTSADILVATLEKADAIATLDELATLSDLARNQLPAAAEEIRATEDRLRLGRGAERRWSDAERPIALSEPPAAASTEPAPRPDSIGNAPTDTTANAAPAPARAASPPAGTGLTAVQRAAQQGDWTRCLALSANSTQPAVIYQRGWCAYNLDRPMEAITAFQTAINGLGSSEQRRDAAYGLLLSMLSLNMTEQAAQVAAAAPLTRAQRIAVEGQILDQRGVAAFENGDYARAVAFFRAHLQLTGTRRRDLALLEGYALLNMGDRAAARAIFEELHTQLATDATRRALRALN